MHACCPETAPSFIDISPLFFTQLLYSDEDEELYKFECFPWLTCSYSYHLFPVESQKATQHLINGFNFIRCWWKQDECRHERAQESCGSKPQESSNQCP
ncbi:hypothetical protein V6N13_148788 [Hibiscus sabdariffa]|uniref:Uncharacterized protein n=1 Tax=Hibiscus sabdariffa TaxID=183260 RepID=A0ABR2EJP8_9ROSI